MTTQAPPPFEFLPLGAIIRTFLVGGPSHLNIVQNFPKQSHYVSHNGPFFGETIGRVANRIASGKIDSLNNKSYQLVQNNGVNALHGGNIGWGKRVWEGPSPVGVKSIPGLEGGELEGGESVKFTLRSEDGDEGYPGTVDVSVIYTVGLQKSSTGKEIRVLGIEYQVELVGDEVEETVVNVTNHSYFNLSGKSTIEGTEITLCSTAYLPVDDGGIPTSSKTAGYPGLKAKEKFTLGLTEPDVDDCFIVDPSTASSIPLDTRSSPLTKLVAAYHPETKVHLEVLSTEPAFQFYTGKYIDVAEINEGGEKVEKRGARAGFCVEPSRYVNAVNVPEWRAQVVLKKGEVYGSRVVYKGWCDE
ncbi:related to GAL10-UDP-glucose 4-epimerase [Rhynchosporium agropyri]|uniref:Related to GAL10-UDP-glucose 4-epimerase n=1 Tax=Rhynchosporium agropyri TaxID=914238 RepID=A0A1E1KSB0_9HELO|nr:related to GAL10-UDP-glucose 4-epimerase [Rhynchosporium agropyri]